MSELVSVILTTYDNPVSLLTSLPSVLNQTYKNLEILIIDGGHNKYTKKTVDTFIDKRIIYIKVNDGSDNKICGNIQYCRNFGVSLAQGKFVAMLDDDDGWHKDKIFKQVKLAAMSNAGLICCHTIKYRLNCTKHKVIINIDKPKNNPKYTDLLKSFNYSQTSTYFMNKKKLLDCGGFNDKLRSMHEYDVALRMLKKGYRIAVVEQSLVTSHCANTASKKYFFVKIAELLDLWRCYGDDMIKKLKVNEMLMNVTKTVALVILYSAGYIFGGCVWRIIFKFKEMYQQ